MQPKLTQILTVYRLFFTQIPFGFGDHVLIYEQIEMATKYLRNSSGENEQALPRLLAPPY